MECAPVQELLEEKSLKPRVVNHISHNPASEVGHDHASDVVYSYAKTKVLSLDIPIYTWRNFMQRTAKSARPAPAVLLIVIVVTGQAVALVVNAVLTILDPDSQELPGTAMLFLVFLFVLGAVWLLAAARGVYQGKAWPRGALAVAEVLAVIVSFTYLQLGDVLIGTALLISGGVVLVTLFTPPLNSYLIQRRG